MSIKGSRSRVTNQQAFGDNWESVFLRRNLNMGRYTRYNRLWKLLWCGDPDNKTHPNNVKYPFACKQLAYSILQNKNNWWEHITADHSKWHRWGRTFGEALRGKIEDVLR